MGVDRMGVVEREPMIRAIRAALDEHDGEHQNNDGRAMWAVLAVEPLIAEQLEGAVGVIGQARSEFRFALDADEGGEYLRDLMRDFIAAADAAIGGQ